MQSDGRRVGLEELLRYLTSCDEAAFKGTQIDKYLSSISFQEDMFASFTHFREDTYGRNLIYKNQYFELLALTWLPEQRTAIHDHAGQRCWMFMDTGSLSFKTYLPMEGNKGILKPVGPVETRSAGCCVYIDDEIGTHSIANASKKPAVSIHLYAGPIPECRIYDEATREFKRVTLQYLTETDWSPDWSDHNSRLVLTAP